MKTPLEFMLGGGRQEVGIAVAAEAEGMLGIRGLVWAT